MEPEWTLEVYGSRVAAQLWPGARNKGRCPTYVILTLSLRDKGGALCVSRGLY